MTTNSNAIDTADDAIQMGISHMQPGTVEDITTGVITKFIVRTVTSGIFTAYCRVQGTFWKLPDSNERSDWGHLQCSGQVTVHVTQGNQPPSNYKNLGQQHLTTQGGSGMLISGDPDEEMSRLNQSLQDLIPSIQSWTNGNAAYQAVVTCTFALEGNEDILTNRVNTIRVFEPAAKAVMYHIGRDVVNTIMSRFTPIQDEV
ncbi:hypothetical protein M231_04510 [Tremella mesenterica]|uniref:Uncharacterized protein n=1 Tax=Tremella mesenterica TaxID=5217 RepID=A0A4Q1BKL5_TREME|nr:uncharacterized protein TREMEDRAFT_65742 [Tremella mesenterica DSM 1558]EIW66146.1 hypothetical protein TREMEDRAFT_65742 [Tremella mesenterica DSM 1558]RXK38226.1 hypothetical protein M231_04510 [Tremella mesenterica]